ncbi:predicted protein [Chaetoceros tenuissimus]|uniref:CHAT domain-containing protein n=1 Tax=Chaetoceros tenuissimus TaxID=426638 RepID=A0AAD3CXB0_9STRA|nr:predicted protein [Chaetoceros tenuissimus]
MYYSDKGAFVKDILPELGIVQKLEQFRFKAILESKPKPLENELYAIFNFLDGNELAVKGEEEIIRKNLRSSSYFSFAYKVLRDDKNFEKLHSELVAHQECKVVHFGMHGSSIDTFVTTTLASHLQESSVQCIVLNMCESEHIANDLRDKAKTEKVLYWLSGVEDNAAQAFSEAFYYYLCVNKKANYLEFGNAFQFAKERLKLRGYLLIDPTDKDELEDKKIALLNPTLKAAGIPKLLERSMQQKDNQEHEANQTMQVGTMNSSVLQESTQSAASTMIASQHPYNSQQMINAQNSFSKKRKREDGDVEQRDSDDASLKASNESPSVPKPKVDDYHTERCQLKCNYIFTKCTSEESDHTIVSNCQFIKYKAPSDWETKGVKSLEHDIFDLKKTNKCKWLSKLKQCKKCGIYYCNEKKVPSEGSSVVNKSCFDVHVCSKVKKAKPDITIRIEYKECFECNRQYLKKAAKMAGF